MKGKNNILKPTSGRLILTGTFLSYHYFFTYAGLNIYFFDLVSRYLKIGLSTIHWNNYFIRSGFLVLLWLLIAFIIYFAIWGYESLRISLHNRKIKKKYLNKQKEEYAELLLIRSMKVRTHLKKYLYFGGSATLTMTAFLMFSELFESLRYGITDNIAFRLIENGVQFDPTGATVLTISFVGATIVWYLYSCLVSWIHEKGKSEEAHEKISDEHFAVIADEPNSEEIEDPTEEE